MSNTRNFAGTLPGFSQPAAPRRQELRVMSFNIRVKTFLDMFGNSWDGRKDLLIETIREFNPDVLGTQEALADQADYLRENLTGYGFVGVGRDDGQRKGEMCGVFYKTDRFDLLDSGHFWLSKRPETPGSKGWDAGFPRMVTWVKLRPRDGSDSFCIFNTHFDVFGSHARLESAKMLRERMQEIAPGMPVVVTGDFNDSPGSAPYRTMLGEANGTVLTDAFRATHTAPSKAEGTRHDFHGGKSGPRIDWIMTTGFTPVDSAISYNSQGNKYPSDHFPVTAILRPSGSEDLARIE